ncbi:MAG TPA: AGE family epimerase/isomerase [Ohtaekwangia sp.]
MKTPAVIFALVIVLGCTDKNNSRSRIADEMDNSLRYETLEKWYPLAVDTLYGGFLSSYTHDFKPADNQDKMIVTQARHTWTNARASRFYSGVDSYKANARHGFEFLKAVMWDEQYGGFYTRVDYQGNVKDSSKTAYGNAFGIYALAACYQATEDTAVLNLVKQAFLWLEKHSHDSVYSGYYQHLKRNGERMPRTPETSSLAETGYKDQNSSIHLLEAFTELYQVWPDPLVKERLEEMLKLIRDTIVTPKGYMTLFFTPDWTPVSFIDSTKAVIAEHHRLDHVSFGHDVETAYLLTEASHVLELKDDTVTYRIAKKMVDHALTNGWDNTTGGFYDEGYYFKGSSAITITHETKNWWAQAEGLNTLLLMADLYPDDSMAYFQKFETLWRYADKYLIDHEHGDWFEGGLDKQPEKKTALKGHIWKGNYHHYRSLENCITRLRSTRPQQQAH